MLNITFEQIRTAIKEGFSYDEDVNLRKDLVLFFGYTIEEVLSMSDDEVYSFFIELESDCIEDFETNFEWICPYNADTTLLNRNGLYCRLKYDSENSYINNELKGYEILQTVERSSRVETFYRKGLSFYMVVYLKSAGLYCLEKYEVNPSGLDAVKKHFS